MIYPLGQIFSLKTWPEPQSYISTKAHWGKGGGGDEKYLLTSASSFISISIFPSLPPLSLPSLTHPTPVRQTSHMHPQTPP